MNTLQIMSNGQLQFIDADTGEPVEFLGDEEIAFDERSNARIWKKWSDTPTGAEFYTRLYSNPHNQEALISVFKKLYSDERLTVSRLIDAFETALSAGEFSEPKPTPAKTNPRKENGQFQNPLVAEYILMLNSRDVPASAISARMRTDRAFREAVQAASTPEPQRQRGIIPSEEETAQLRAFASSYRLAKTLRPLQGRITLSPTEDYSVAEFNELVERASQFGLL